MLIGQSGVRKEFEKEQKNLSYFSRRCENVRMEGGGESDLKTGRWADKHNQEDGMSAGVSAEAWSVCWMCRG